LAGCIYLSAAIDEPGVVKQVGGAGEYFFGPSNGFTEPFEYIEELLKESGIKANLSDNIVLKLWEKYIFVCSLATITTYTRQSIGAVVANIEWKELWIRLMLEIFMIARQKGVYLPTGIMQDCVARASGAPFENKTSMQLDFEKGKEKNEMDIFTNYVIQMGKETGAPVFLHKMIQEKIMNQLKML
jgi:2-dehydropantoate 2-reductase